MAQYWPSCPAFNGRRDQTVCLAVGLTWLQIRWNFGLHYPWGHPKLLPAYQAEPGGSPICPFATARWLARCSPGCRFSDGDAVVADGASSTRRRRRLAVATALAGIIGVTWTTLVLHELVLARDQLVEADADGTPRSARLRAPAADERRGSAIGSLRLVEPPSVGSISASGSRPSCGSLSWLRSIFDRLRGPSCIPSASSNCDPTGRLGGRKPVADDLLSACRCACASSPVPSAPRLATSYLPPSYGQRAAVLQPHLIRLNDRFGIPR